MDQVRWGLKKLEATRGRVAYTGKPFAAVDRTYRGIDLLNLDYATQSDSGTTLSGGSSIGSLRPLIAAALLEAGFAQEAGPLSTWSN